MAQINHRPSIFILYHPDSYRVQILKFFLPEPSGPANHTGSNISAARYIMTANGQGERENNDK
jgi:hypothetical protein